MSFMHAVNSARNNQITPSGRDSTPLTRDQKTKSFLTDVLPAAINLGLGAAEGIGSGETKAQGATRKSSTKKIDKASGALTGVSTAAGAVSVAGGWAGAVMGAVDIAMNWGKSTPSRGAASGSAIGAMIGTCITPGIGTAIGAAIGAVAGGLLGSIKTGKHKDQKARDAVRAFLVEKGVLAEDYTIGLADGSRFNVGLDGGPKKELGGRRPYEVDMNNPLSKYAISWMSPAIALLSQGNEKIQNDFVGYFANAALSNAKSIGDVKENVNAVLEQFGMNDEILAKATAQAANAGLIDQQTAEAWLNGINERRAAK